MIRIIITFLAITLGAPAMASAGSLQSRGFSWVGPGCCAKAQTQAQKSQPQRSKIKQACCCSLSPLSKVGSDKPQLLVPSEQLVVAATLPAALSLVTIELEPQRIASVLAGARAPPNLTLRSQHILYLI